MELSGLHFLLSYACSSACEHCFVWGSPRQTGTFTLRDLREVLRQGRALGSLSSVYFEGGEPFLFYPILLRVVRGAADMGFRVGIVTNGYWGTAVEDALVWLRPLRGLVADLSVSSDEYHEVSDVGRSAAHIRKAAQKLGISSSVISIAQPEGSGAPGASPVMYRGRAAVELAPRAPLRSCEEFVECPHEDLEEPGRLHVDPYGNLHLCQGIVVGNTFRTALSGICREYDVEAHPVTGPLRRGGPVGLVREYDLPHDGRYADACHMCYEARVKLRPRFPDLLCPDQMYGAPGE